MTVEWKPVRRWLAASTAFAAAVAVGVVVLGPDDSSVRRPESSPGHPAAAGPGQDALVDRVLGQLRQGRPVERQPGSGDNPVRGVPIAAIKAKPGQQLQLGRLAIPKLKVDQELNNGVDEAALLSGVGHWPGTPLPGNAGNAVISGHRSTNERPFLHLERLRPGDPVKVTLGARVTTYKVVKTTIVAERDYVKFVLRQPTQAGVRTITLFACNPVTAHYQRIVVQARAS